MSTKNHNRSKENTTLTISLSREMKDRLQQLADAENRPVSNYVRHYLETRVMETPPDPDSGNADSPQTRASAPPAPTAARYSYPKLPRKTNRK
jgi:hypothetical protein